MRRARVHPAVAALLPLLAAAIVGGSAAAQDALRFPKPDRPVARIVTPHYSTEEARDRHGEAQRVMDRLGVKPGMRVADVGAGDGYYTVRLAHRLGPGATIYAQDVEPRYLNGLAKRLERESIRGVRLVLGTPGDPKLPPDSIDVAILSHMYHEIENPYEFLYRLWPTLARGADFVALDPADGYLAVFTSPEALRAPGSIRPYAR